MSQRYAVFFFNLFILILLCDFFISPHWCFKSALESILHCQDECG